MLFTRSVPTHRLDHHTPRKEKHMDDMASVYHRSRTPYKSKTPPVP